MPDFRLSPTRGQLRDYDIENGLSFCEGMRAILGRAPAALEPDGEVHDVPSPGACPETPAVRYCLFLGENPCGAAWCVEDCRGFLWGTIADGPALVRQCRRMVGWRKPPTELGLELRRRLEERQDPDPSAESTG